MSDLLRRQTATEKTRKRYDRAAFSWGRNDCLKMARTHLLELGHKPPKIPAYQTALGAKRALQKKGFSDLATLFDSLLPRISPASRLVGDIVLLKGEGGLHCVTIAISETKVAGWHGDQQRFVTMTPLEIEGTWRA